MTLWKPDILAEISLLPTEAGGRKSQTPSEWFGCPVQVDGKYFDARIDLSELGPIEPGQTVQAPLKFLWPEGALSHFSVGKVFSIWEGRIIGSGRVLTAYAHA